MPGSDEMFGGTDPGSMLPGEQRELPPSLFNFAGDQQHQGPTPEELEQDYDRALHTKHVRLKAVNIKTFDLSVRAQCEEYCKLCTDIYNIATSGQTVVQVHERKFVEQPVPRWVVHIEWWEYALVVDGKEMTPQEFEAWKKLQTPATPPEPEGEENGP